MGRVFQESDFIDSPQSEPTQITIGLSGKPRVFSESDFMPEQAAPTFASEATGVKNQFLRGVGDLGNLYDTVTSYADPIRSASRITDSLFGREPQQPAGDALTQALSKIGILGEETAQTGLGKFAEGVARVVPQVFTPGGFGKSALQATLAGGAAGGIARANDASESTQALVSALGSLAPDALRIGARGLSALVGGEDTGMALRRKSLGPTAADYRQTADDLKSYDIPDDSNEVETLTKKILNKFIDTGELGASRKPAQLTAQAIRNEKALDNSLWEAINTAESQRSAPTIPTFKRALSYIDSGKVDASTINDRIAEVEKLKSAIIEKGKGSLPFLHNQRVAWGGKYEQGNKSLNGFYKAVYHDLNDTLRKAIPNYGAINKEIQAYQIVRPILEKGLSREEAGNAIGNVIQKLKTTGGTLTTPTVIGSILGGSVGGPVGFAAGAALGHLAEPSGMDQLGRAIVAGSKKAPNLAGVPQSTSSLIRAASEIGSGSPSASAAGISQSRTDSTGRSKEGTQSSNPIVPRDDKGRFIEHTSENLKASKAKIRSALEQSAKELKPMEKKTAKDPRIQEIEAQIDSDPVDSTIYEMESSRNPKAKNKTSTASGGFQLIAATAKKLGVEDPFDLGQNYEGYKKLKAEAAPYVDEPSDYYAFHYLGQPTYLAWKKGKVLTLKQQEQVNYLEDVLIPKFERIYSKKAKKSSGVVEA